jgi:hypothetical protein
MRRTVRTPTVAEIDAAAEALIADEEGEHVLQWYREYPEKKSRWWTKAKVALRAAERVRFMAREQ